MEESWEKQMESDRHFVQRRTSPKKVGSPSHSRREKGSPGEERPNPEKTGGHQRHPKG